MEAATVKTTQPCLLAVGPRKDNILNYYIAVDGKLIPTDALTADAAFDVLFKTHFVLDTQFDGNMKSFYEFMHVYFYNMEPAKIQFTPRMREVRTWLSNANKT